MISSNAETRRFLLLPLVLIPALFAIPFAFGEVLLFRDLIHFTIPEQQLVGEALRAGRLPLWNPLVYGGIPCLASPSTGVFYPANWLFAWLDPFRAGAGHVLLHLPVAAAGTFLLSRVLGLSWMASVLAACGYVTSGYLLSMHGGHLYFASAALLPLATALLLRAADRRSVASIAWAAGAIALLVLNGEFQAILFAGLLAIALSLSRPAGAGSLSRPAALRLLALRLSTLAAAALLGTALSMVQLLPTLAFARGTTRSGGLPLEEATLWSLHPLRWIEWLLPQPFGLPYPENGFWGSSLLHGVHQVPWAVSLCIGPLLFVLAISTPLRRVGGRRRALAIAAGLALLLAAGALLPVFSLWVKFIPLADRFRYPEKYALPATLCLVILGAARLDDLLASADEARRTRRWFLLVSLPLLGAALAVALQPAPLLEVIRVGLAAGQGNVPAGEACQELCGSLLQGALLSGVGVLACSLPGRPRMLSALLVGAVAAAGTANGLRLLSYGAVEALQSAPLLVGAIRQALPRGSAGRVISDGSCRFSGGGEGTLLERVRAFHWQTGKENLLTLFGIKEAIGYGAAEVPEQVELFHALRRLGFEVAARRFGAAVIVGCDGAGHPRLTIVADPLPRVRLVPARAAPGTTEALALALASAAPGGGCALIAGNSLPGAAGAAGAAGAVQGCAAAGSASLADERPELISVHTEGGPGALVLSDSFAPGWSVAVDGESAALLREGGLYRAVLLTAGTHEVIFRYQAPGLRAGALVSAATLLLVLLALALARVRRTPASRL